MAKSPEELAQTMIDNLKEKTGKTLDQWLVVASKVELSKHGEILKYLKQTHGVSHGFANLIAAKALDAGKPEATGTDLIDAQYGGAKADLRPIYETLLKAIKKFGKDVKVAPKEAYVSLRRSKQFAIIQPSTKTRIDVGINCKSAAFDERMEESGSFNSMVSHRVRVESVADVDSELITWLRNAYNEA